MNWKPYIKYMFQGRIHDLHIVTQYKDNRVYKTKSLGIIIYDRAALPYKDNKDIIEASLSTTITRQMY